MKAVNHPYLKYAQALLLEQNKLSSVEQINVDLIKKEIELGLSHFSVQVCGDYEGKSSVKFSFSESRNNAKQYVFLAPNVISTEMLSKNIYKSVKEILLVQDIDLAKSTDIAMSDMPICGEFNSFSEKGCGIGTSATRAGILTKLFNNGYLNLNKKTQIITPTLLGEIINDTVYISIPSLLHPKLTASWEKGLTMVANGEVDENDYLNKLTDYVSEYTNDVKKNDYRNKLSKRYSYIAQFYK